MAKKSDGVLDLNSILHPAAAFDHPRDVARDPDLTLNEKRAILASWASDACSVESAPTLRRSPDGKAIVCFEDIVEVLRELDREAHAAPIATPHYRRVLQRQRGNPKFLRKRGSPGGRGGSPLQ